MGNTPSYIQKKQQVQALCQQGRFAEAIDACKALCDVNPNDAEAWFILAALHGAFEQFDEAERCCRKSIAIAPQIANTHYNLGFALLNLQRPEEAEISFREVIRMQPGNAVAHSELGNALWEQDKYDEAMACFRQAVQYDPAYANGYRYMAEAFARYGARPEAIECFQKVHQLSGADFARIRMAMVLPAITTSVTEIDDIRQQMANSIQALLSETLEVQDPVKDLKSTNFFLAYHGRNDLHLQVKAAELYLHACPGLAYVSPDCQAASGKKNKIKIGFISSFLKHHSIGKTSKGLIERLDRERFEVVVIRFDEPADQTAGAISGYADKTLVIPAKLAGARTLIEQEGLDILFYQDIGMEPFTYFLAFSRLAPVQCTTFGHPVTTGIPTMDYFVSTDYYEPDNGQTHYSEKLFLLKDVASCAYYYQPELPSTLLVRQDFGLSEHEHIYICPQALFKLHPEFDPIMAGILRSDSAGRIILIEGSHPAWQQQLEHRFQEHMPDVADRIQFLPPQKDGYFTNLLAVSDVILDTIHFGGQNTTHEGLSAGTPIVTWPGEFHRGRHVYGFYRRMGMMDCVANSHEEYVSIAVRLANDQEFRARVQAEILEKRHIVWQEERVVSEFERFFTEAMGLV